MVTADDARQPEKLEHLAQMSAKNPSRQSPVCFALQTNVRETTERGSTAEPGSPRAPNTSPPSLLRRLRQLAPAF